MHMYAVSGTKASHRSTVCCTPEAPFMSTHRGPARHRAEYPDRGAARGQEKSRLRALTLDQPPFSHVTHKEVPASKRKPKR